MLGSLGVSTLQASGVLGEQKQPSKVTGLQSAFALVDKANKAIARIVFISTPHYTVPHLI